MTSDLLEVQGDGVLCIIIDKKDQHHVQLVV